MGQKVEEKKKNKILRYGLRAILAIIVLAIIIYISLPRLSCGPIPAYKVICLSNLHGLMTVCQVYRKENNLLWPQKETWCDVFHQEYDSELERFRCPKDKTGPCSYAMNENIPADVNELPPDLVLLFESAPGWNQVGGPDDVVTDRHGENNLGANIAFADGRVEFVKPEDIPNLRWTVE